MVRLRNHGATARLVLESLTAGMFLLFAILLLRSAPAAGAEQQEPASGFTTDGGQLDVRVPVVDWQVPTSSAASSQSLR